MAGSARKPYLRLKKSLVDFFRAPIVFIKNINQKFSEFEKPYKGEAYPQMHLNWPKGDWGGPWTGPKRPPTGPFGKVPTVWTVGCVVHCWHHQDCDEWVDCSVLHWSGEIGKQGSVSITGDVLETQMVWSGLVDFRFKVDPDVSNPFVLITYTDPTGQTCIDTVDLTCVDCDETAVISYSTLQMAVDEEQTLQAYVNGSLDDGQAYVWAITSGGGSLDSSTGNSVTYTAPSSNANCSSNPTITLSCDGTVIDSIEIAVNEWGGAENAYQTCHWMTPTPPAVLKGQARSHYCDGSNRAEEYACWCNGPPVYTGTCTGGV